MKYILNAFIMFCILISNVKAQPLRYNDDNWPLEETPVNWEPAQINVTTGDLTLKVWILRNLVPAPESGYLISRSDWIEIRRMLDSLDEEIKRVKNSERSSCDKRLKEKDIFCKNLNKDLVKEIDQFKKDISFKSQEISSLKKENFWTKIITGAAILGLSGLSIYQATK